MVTEPLRAQDQRGGVGVFDSALRDKQPLHSAYLLTCTPKCDGVPVIGAPSQSLQLEAEREPVSIPGCFKTATRHERGTDDTEPLRSLTPGR